MSKTILVIAAHTDDEAIGCGGTIARHAAEKDKVYALFMTDGVGSRQADKKEALSRKHSAQQAAKVLGINETIQLDFPDNRMDAVALLDIVKAIEETISKVQPEIIYTHHYGDLNIDHKITHQAVMTACRPQPDFPVKEIYAFEVLSSTEWQTPETHAFHPNTFIDISDHFDRKLTALKCYSDEMRQSPHSRSMDNIVNLAKLRGNTVGMHAAEAFVLLRKLQN